MNIKKLIAAILCVCIISASLFTLAGCGNQKDTTTPTESDVETEAKAEEIKDDSKRSSEFVDTTIEDGSVVYKVTKKALENYETHYNCAYFLHCFKNDVEQWVYETTIQTGGQFGDGSNLMEFDENNVYISICRTVPDENFYSSTIAIDKKTGKEAWCVNDTGYADILLDEENVYVSGFDGHGICVISKDGELKAEGLGDYGGHMVFIDENTIAGFGEADRVDVDVSEYKSKDTIPEKIYKCLPITVTASSTLAPGNGKTYDTKNLIDRNPATVWSEGEDGLGEGTTLTVDLGKKTTIKHIYIRNGHSGSEELFKKNGKAVEVEIDYNNGTEPQKVFLFNSYIGWTPIGAFNGREPMECSSFTIKILEAEAGTEYEDVCISDIEVYSEDIWENYE